MGPAERLKLLFSQDEAILQINTGLRPVPEPEPEEPEMAEQETPLVELSANQMTKLTISVPEDGKTLAPAVQRSEAPSPHDGTFCPILAMSRYPYHYIRGDLMQKVASRFFDRGQFWEREWDL